MWQAMEIMVRYLLVHNMKGLCMYPGRLAQLIK